MTRKEQVLRSALAFLLGLTLVVAILWGIIWAVLEYLPLTLALPVIFIIQAAVIRSNLRDD